MVLARTSGNISESESSMESSSLEAAHDNAIAKMMVAACLGMLQFGYSTGIIAGALLYIESSPEFAPMSTMSKSTLVSCVTIGAMCGALLSGAHYHSDNALLIFAVFLVLICLGTRNFGPGPSALGTNPKPLAAR